MAEQAGATPIPFFAEEATMLEALYLLPETVNCWGKVAVSEAAQVCAEAEKSLASPGW